MPVTPNTPRTRHGRFDRDPAAAHLDAEAAGMRAKGAGYRQIAAAQQCSLSVAYDRVQHALAAVPVEAVNELRAVEADRIDRVIAKLWTIVEAAHPYVSNGRVFTDLEDSAPVIAALTGILRASESKRKLFGLDAPARQTITVITEDVVDAELRRLEEALADAEHEDADRG